MKTLTLLDSNRSFHLVVLSLMVLSIALQLQQQFPTVKAADHRRKLNIPDAVRKEVADKIQQHLSNKNKIVPPNPILEQVQEVPPLAATSSAEEEEVARTNNNDDDDDDNEGKVGDGVAKMETEIMDHGEDAVDKDDNKKNVETQQQVKRTSPRRKRVEKCEDKHPDKKSCKEWAWFGECEKNPGFMHEMCQKSCDSCTAASLPAFSTTSNDLKLYNPDGDDDECRNWFDECQSWAEEGNDKVSNLCNGHWRANKGTWIMTGAYVVEFCPKACKTCDIHLDDRDITLGIGLPQSYPGMDEDKELRNYLKSKVAETRDYVASIKDDKIREVCKMSHPNCARFALSSDCGDHKDHPLLKYGCAAACQTCEELINGNGIHEAEQMWTNAFRDWNDARQKKADNSHKTKDIDVTIL